MANPSSNKRFVIGAALIAVAGAVLWALTLGPLAGGGAKSASGGAPAIAKPSSAAAVKPALTVSPVKPRAAQWPRSLEANGNVAAWQEAVIGAEISNLRLTEVLVNVGDRVKKGQVLARIDAQTVQAELAQTRASVTEAEAALAEAQANAERARRLKPQGMISGQQYNQLITAEQTAQARLAAARARLRAEDLRVGQARIVAPDDGIIATRTATVGSLTQPGQELFRLIRGGRLEWRAEVTAAELAKVSPGDTALVTTPAGATVQGRVRTVAPTVDAQSRMALVYVDLPAQAGGLRSGMFARGSFELGASAALTLPQTAVVLREGFAYVFRIDGDKVIQTKVELGRRDGDEVEIAAGLTQDAAVVAQGAGFLADGDTVRVVGVTEAPAAAQAPAQSGPVQ